MKVSRLNLILTTDRANELFSFYRDVIGLPEAFDSGPGEGLAGGAVDLNHTILIIEEHSETSGKAEEPQRHFLDLHVDDAAAEQRRRQKQGVEFIREAEREDWGGVIATFLDLDGNYVQLVQQAQD